MRTLILAAAVLCVGFPNTLLAQSPACPDGNLLKQAQVKTTGGVTGVERLNDEEAAVEGDLWNSAFAAVLPGEQSSIVFDLGALTTMDAFYIQSDNNDTLRFSVSEDGLAYSAVWKMLSAKGQGVRSRAHVGANAVGRYLKIDQPRGDGSFSVTEVQAFCRAPTPWPPKIKRKVSRSWWITKFLKNTEARAKMAFAILGLFVFIGLFKRDAGARRAKFWLSFTALPALAMALYSAYSLKNAKHTPFFAEWCVYVFSAAIALWFVQLYLARRESLRLGRVVEVGALLCIAFSSVVAFTNFGAFHNSRVVHYWDMYHYYVGPKYFAENRYDGLYECTVAADSADRGARDMQDRKIRNLNDNELQRLTPEMVKEYEERCAERFTPERWEAFRQDARMFRSFMGDSWWKDMVMDHGYNPSPVWNMLGSAAANIGWESLVPPDTEAFVPSRIRRLDPGTRSLVRERYATDKEAHRSRIRRFAAVDGLLYLSVFVLIGWAFGLRAAVLAILVWGVGYPWGYFWTGGSFGRVPWLFMSTASVCLLKKGQPFLGGVAMTWAMLLRVFPGALIAGIALKIAAGALKFKLSRSHAMFIAGCTVALLVLVVASLPSAGGFEAYPEFVQNSFKHKSTPLTNHMGLPTVLAYHPSKVGRHTKDPSLADPWQKWKDGRHETLEQRRWLWLLCLFSMLGLLAYSGRYLEDWAVTAASVLMIIGVFELTCYYYNFIVLMVPLAVKRLRYVVAMLSMICVGQVLKFIVGWYDEQYQWETVILLSVLLYIVIDTALEKRALNASQTPHR